MTFLSSRASMRILAVCIMVLFACSGCGNVDPETKKAIKAKEAELDTAKKEFSKIEDSFDDLNENTLKKRKTLAISKAKAMTARLQLRMLEGEKHPADLKEFLKVMGTMPKDPVHFKDLVLVKDKKNGIGKIKGGWIYIPEKGVVEANL